MRRKLASKLNWMVVLTLIVVALLTANSAFAVVLSEESRLEAEMSRTSGSESGDSGVNAGLDIQYTPIQYRNYSYVDGVKSDTAGSGIHFALEWLPLPERFGKFGIGAGFGLYKIKDVQLGEDRIASLYAYPIDAFVSYRFDYFRDQLFVPYGKFGSSLTLVNQSSTTGGGRPGTQVFPTLDYGGGLEICLNPLDPEAAHSLDRSVGINGTYVLVEYLKSKGLGNRNPTLSHEEVRLGLRFEM